MIYWEGFPFRFGPGECCCPFNCIIWNDDFNREESDDPGFDLGWIEDNGDWDIVEGTLTAVRNDQPVTWCVRESINPYLSDNKIIRAELHRFVDGSKHRLIVDCQDDGSGGYWAEWHYQDSNNMYFRLGSGDSTVIAEIGPELPIEEGTVCMLFLTEGGQLCMSDTSSRLTECVDNSGNDYTGVGSAGTDGIGFDEYYFIAHYDDFSDCPVCDCSCSGHCVPWELVADFDEDEYCPALDGFTMSMLGSGPTKYGQDWLTDVVQCGATNYEDIQLSLSCTGGGFLGVDEFALTIQQGSFVVAADNSQTAYPDPEVSTCHPLSLRFGPFTYGNVSGCYETTCCHGEPCPPDESTFYIWVTE